MEIKKWFVNPDGFYICPVCGEMFKEEALFRGKTCPNCNFNEGIELLSKIVDRDEKIKGAKYDDNKPRPSTVPVEAIEAIMATRGYGLAKYAEAENWRSIEPERWHEALLRHVLAIWEDPTHIDEESGLPSLWHVMTNGAFLCACLKDILEEKRNV